MRINRTLVLLTIFAFSYAHAAEKDARLRGCHATGGSNEDVCEVSMTALVANPEVYDGRIVRLIGFLADGRFPILFMSKEAYMASVVADGVALDRPKDKETVNKLTSRDRSMVIIQGRFSAKGESATGMGADMTAGSLLEITRVGGSQTPWGLVQPAIPSLLQPQTEK